MCSLTVDEVYESVDQAGGVFSVHLSLESVFLCFYRLGSVAVHFHRSDA